MNWFGISLTHFGKQTKINQFFSTKSKEEEEETLTSDQELDQETENVIFEENQEMKDEVEQKDIEKEEDGIPEVMNFPKQSPPPKLYSKSKPIPSSLKSQLPRAHPLSTKHLCHLPINSTIQKPEK